MRKKALLKLILIGVGIFSTFLKPVYGGENSPKFFINGREVWNKEIIIKEGTTYVPLRIVANELGAGVDYDNASKSIEIKKENKVLNLVIGKEDAILNNNKIKLSKKVILYKTKDGENLAYLPLRNIFEIFDGYVDYNKDYNFVNAYNKSSIPYKALDGLKSEDLTTYRFAQLALPRIGADEGMYIHGGRVTEYIFPLDKKANYFFIRTDPSGDTDISTMAYLEVENGVAIGKWGKVVRGDIKNNINPLNNTINLSLGARGIEQEVGKFPSIEDTEFISFRRHFMIQPSPEDDQLESYKETFNDMISILTPSGYKNFNKDLVQDTLWSPYLTEYKIQDVPYGEYRISYYNDTIMTLY